MVERLFSKKCGNCKERRVTLTALPSYSTQIEQEGRTYTINLSPFQVPRCENCKTIVLDEEANRQISAAFRKEAGLLGPDQIRQARVSLNLTQQALADLLGVAITTLSRWEAGAQIQQRSLDRFLRAFFNLPQLRSALVLCQPHDLG